MRTLRHRSIARLVAVLACAAWLAGCGDRAAPEATPAASESSGQVAAPVAAKKVGFYAASRFAEQTSFGPTPALVEAIQTKGLEKWIDEQFALPASQINLTPYLVNQVPPTDWQDSHAAFASLALTAPDQLRVRVAWVLAQFIVTNAERGDPLGRLVFQNLLINRALSRYEQLLYEVSTNPHMGEQFDIRTNRPRSGGCAQCAPNELYARVLLEQYTVGAVQLKPDGTPQRDARGRPAAAYTQRDVSELTRVLTGWNHDPSPPNNQRIPRDWGNWRKPMVASSWPGDRDFGAKQLLGTSFAEYQSAGQELEQALQVLATQPNTSLHVALRLIQGLVKSQPSAAYLQRVAAVFRDNGSGVRGDMKAVVKAVLLDAEARAADDPSRARRDDGRVRDPFLVVSALHRSLGCQRILRWNWSGPTVPDSQAPFQYYSVTGVFHASDRAPVSHLLAPEQRLLSAQEFNQRQGIATWFFDYDSAGRPTTPRAQTAGCNMDELTTRYQRSPTEFMAWLGERFFRGALPPALRQNLEILRSQKPWNDNYASEAPTRLLSYALFSPYWGVIE